MRRQSISGVDLNPLLRGLVVVEINPTELCNRTCSFCPRVDGAIYPNRNLNMSIDTATVLRQQLIANGFKGYVCVAGFGEPLLNPHIREIIRTLAPLTIELITNGDALIKGKFSVDDLLDCGVDRILISDYDNNPEFDKLASQHPQVRVRRYIDDGGDHYKEYGFNNRAGSMYDVTQPINRPCYIPSYKTIIDWNGEVLLCAPDWSKTTKYGNILEQDISNIWLSDEFVKRRIELIKGNRHLYGACSKCDVLGNIMGKQYADLFHAD